MVSLQSDNRICVSAEKHLAEYAEWTAPRAGMFLWLKLKQIPDCMQIFEDLKAANVVVVPGKLFPSCSRVMLAIDTYSNP